MVSVLDPGLSSSGSSPGWDIVLCSWARNLTLTEPLSIQVYKWVLVNLMLEVTCDGLASFPGGAYMYLHLQEQLHFLEVRN